MVVGAIQSTVGGADGMGKIVLNIPYKSTSQGTLRLDLYYPQDQVEGRKFPLVVFAHGGGWTTGDKNLGTRGIRYRGVSALVAQGFCVASVDYRLWTKDGEIMIRDCVTDSKDALRFLTKNANLYHLDAENVFTFGDSAGGQIAQMLLLSPPESFPGVHELRDAKYRMVAGVSWYGPCDFEKTELFNPDGREEFRDRFGPRIVKSSILKSSSNDPLKLDAFREVSPINYLRAEGPSLLMIQGDKDTTIPVHHAYYMKERADVLHAPVEIMIIANCGHNFREEGGQLRPSLETILEKTASFLKEQLNASIRKQ